MVRATIDLGSIIKKKNQQQGVLLGVIFVG